MELDPEECLAHRRGRAGGAESRYFPLAIDPLRAGHPPRMCVVWSRTVSVPAGVGARGPGQVASPFQAMISAFAKHKCEWRPTQPGGAVRTPRGRVCVVTGVSASRLHPGRTPRGPGGHSQAAWARQASASWHPGVGCQKRGLMLQAGSGVRVLSRDHPRVCRGDMRDPNDSTPRAAAWQSAEQGPEPGGRS